MLGTPSRPISRGGLELTSLYDHAYIPILLIAEFGSEPHVAHDGESGNLTKPADPRAIEELLSQAKEAFKPKKK
ncbi:MAG: hypothetical protein ABI024_06835 [Vicinamibacterales bacterium]